METLKNYFLVWLKPKQGIRKISDIKLYSSPVYICLIFFIYGLLRKILDVASGDYNSELSFNQLMISTIFFNPIIIVYCFLMMCGFYYFIGKKFGGTANYWQVCLSAAWPLTGTIVIWTLCLSIIALFDISILNINISDNYDVIEVIIVAILLFVIVTSNLYSLIISIVIFAELQNFSIIKSILIIVGSLLIFIIFVLLLFIAIVVGFSELKNLIY